MSSHRKSEAPIARSPGAPIANVAALLSRRAQDFARRGNCYTVGISGAQGSGKSTLAAALQGLLHSRGFATVVLSLDDFYLTRAQRSELARRVHPLLQTRGVPGTHDVALALEVI
ncbi:MAG: adenylyl-sulfate kinase, partial [Steroidobacteraceae bacterium]